MAEQSTSTETARNQSPDRRRTTKQNGRPDDKDDGRHNHALSVPSPSISWPGGAAPPHTYHYHPHYRERLSIRKLVHLIVGYILVGCLTALAIGFLFSIFLVLRVLDDLIQRLIPGRLWRTLRHHLRTIDWPAQIGQWSLRLASLAEWEKNKRASWAYSQRFAHIDGHRLHGFMYSCTSYLSNYLNAIQTKQSSV
ncbi:hypothetical protein BCR43DRAFT_497835 [Syncephalastrum racemosum]|uniref:Uncharacterized protein n=1 Tax=Syncephalastrum racemosum TaxID=13706 RepID=A0A1X2H2W3_SYNRA|nr:hypothetical protein BCR43DRAFT_497835 [Syncephalastrum racemosum]